MLVQTGALTVTDIRGDGHVFPRLTHSDHIDSDRCPGRPSAASGGEFYTSDFSSPHELPQCLVVLHHTDTAPEAEIAVTSVVCKPSCIIPYSIGPLSRDPNAVNRPRSLQGTLPRRFGPASEHGCCTECNSPVLSKVVPTALLSPFAAGASPHSEFVPRAEKGEGRGEERERVSAPTLPTGQASGDLLSFAGRGAPRSPLGRVVRF
ncbi:hypothetical protein PDE_01079 [Penicillium oxalicum 114-2]|uniref:Uncharacterized protein n=1 Tax=Penicillium oxalicum (strain 114-2 / CGMCC 5302) TaxID=933388 RepID=S8AK02_PENO1|nr:hypothetical protein PDE_01079 [Penicillium oxalicum 114-2]